MGQYQYGQSMEINCDCGAHFLIDFNPNTYKTSKGKDLIEPIRDVNSKPLHSVIEIWNNRPGEQELGYHIEKGVKNHDDQRYNIVNERLETTLIYYNLTKAEAEARLKKLKETNEND